MKAYTLLELLIVLIITGIVFVAVVPHVLEAAKNNKQKLIKIEKEIRNEFLNDTNKWN